jgi:hypothetical protein
MSIPLPLTFFYLRYADNHPTTPTNTLPPRHAHSRSEDHHQILHSTEVGRRPPLHSGTVLIYSQFIDDGIIPMALALE